MSTAGANRAGWLKTLHQWHWISSAISLLGMLLFAATGLTLNHAAQIEAHPRVVDRKATVPAPLLALAPAGLAGAGKGNAPLPAPLAAWTAGALGVDVAGRDAEWSADEIYVSMPRPGGEAWVRIARASGEAALEDTDRGWISYLNDLHKGRNAGAAWSWFIDLFAVACLLFSLTGLLILKMHAGNRAGTWPLVGLGVVVPLLLALLFIH
ncbi:MAG: PepSY-associated TM helix domain-containing protein [Betaproteobacteria bacterium]